MPLAKLVTRAKLFTRIVLYIFRLILSYQLLSNNLCENFTKSAEYIIQK